MSYVERTAKKLLPILTEVKKRMIPDKKNSNTRDLRASDKVQSDDDEDLMIDLSKKAKGMKGKGSNFDMKNILGYLN